MIEIIISSLKLKHSSFYQEFCELHVFQNQISPRNCITVSAEELCTLIFGSKGFVC